MKTYLTLCAILLSTFSFAQELKPYYGLLHAHTLYSDGSGTPEEAYKMAKSVGLDFFAVTSHNHVDAEFGANKKYKTPRADGVLIANQPELYNSDSDLTIKRKYKKVWDGPEFEETLKKQKSVMRAAKEATVDGQFIAIPGQEFSSISKGNHVNVLGIDETITVEKGDFKGLIELLRRKKNEGLDVVVQMNHPSVYKDLFMKCSDGSCNKFNDYGIDNGDLGPHFKDLIAATDDFYSLMEVITGPATTEKTYDDYRYDYHHERDYNFYLRQGFHLSPSAGQDNHYKTWGKTSPARMGVWSEELTQEALFEAMRNHRTFATEDSNVSLMFKINGNLMGSNLELDESEGLNIEIEISDADGDGDLPREIELMYGTIEAEESYNATNWLIRDGELLTQQIEEYGTHAINDRIVTGEPEFYYVRITQIDGDRAWSAPIWINHRTTTTPSSEVFVWTKNSSKYYHKQNCISALRIKDTNIRSGSTPPSKRELHACNISDLENDH